MHPWGSLWYLSLCILRVPWGSCMIFHLDTSDWSRGFSFCYHLKIEKHIAESSFLTISKRDGNQVGPIEMVALIFQETAKLLGSQSNLSSRGVMALLYNLIVAASPKSKTEVDHPGPSEKVHITGGTTACGPG